MSKKLLSAIYVSLIFVLGLATFLELGKGVNWVHVNIYGSLWFSVLWGLLVVVGIVYFVKVRICSLPLVVLHASLVIILVGAFVSHVTGRSGTIHLRLESPQDIVEITHNGKTYLHRLDFDVTLHNFEILSDEKGNPVDYRSEFSIGDKEGFVAMNRIFRYGNMRFYQSGYDADGRGSTLMVNRDPYGIPITYCGYVLLLFSLIYFCIVKSVSKFLWLSAIGLTLLWCLYYFVLDGSWSHIPILRSPLLFAHVVSVIMAYSLLLLQAILSAVRLISERKRPRSSLSPMSGRVLKLSLCFLAIGICLGAVWANISWGNYWSWDSKEVWALITFMVYAVPVHRRSFPVFNNARFYNFYMICAFAFVLMTYFGVNYCLIGMHGYN